MSPANTLNKQAEKLEHLALRAAVRQGLRELESQLRRTHQLESALTCFANDYFDAIGDDMRMLGTKQPSDSAALRALAQQQYANTKAVKQCYRNVMKALHPDTAVQSSNPQTMEAAKSAYAANDLASLLCMEIALAPPPLEAADAGRAALLGKLERIQLALVDAETRYTRLTQSVLYTCWQRAEMERMAGRNWIRAISARIHAEMRLQKRAWLASGLARIAA